MGSSVVITDPVLVRFREALTETYGDRLERVVLFGSRISAPISSMKRAKP